MNFTLLTTRVNNAPPSILFHRRWADSINLYMIANVVSIEPQLRVLFVRDFTVAKVDSIGCVVLIYVQCSAGKS